MKRIRVQNNTKDQWTLLREQSESLLLANRRTEILSHSHTEAPLNNVTYSFPIPCHNATTVQESTSTLLAARAYAKAGHVRDAWEALESLFAVQATNGMLPKYRYSPSNDSHYYINHTDIPNWSLFQNFSRLYLPPETAVVNKLGVHGSSRLSTAPLHASLVLDIFYLSKQTKTDVLYLQRHFDRLYHYHDVIHSIVMRGCHAHSRTTSNNIDNTTTTPCYNVLHPWETLVYDEPPLSPLWNESLSQVKSLMKRRDWKPPVRSIHHDDASLFLLECMTNATTNCTTTTDCEDDILQSCPFAMLDVGYASALLKSDADLEEMAHILQDLRMDPSNELPFKLQQLQAWNLQSSHVMDTLLWNEEYEMFLSRYIVFEEEQDDDTTSTFVPCESKFLKHALVNNFMALWSLLTNESRRDAMVFHMMQHSGDFSFDCGPYPLISRGGCRHDDDDDDASVSPLMNYFVSRGLEHNRAIGTSHYLANSTLNLVCGFPNTLSHDNNKTCSNITFWNQYHAYSGTPLSTNPTFCGETASAASIYNLLVADPPFQYTPAPPIGHSWIITLVAAELVVAFLIGVSCVLLNLNLLRRLNAGDSRDALFRMVERSDTGDMQYFSAAASLEEVEDDNENGGQVI